MGPQSHRRNLDTPNNVIQAIRPPSLVILGQRDANTKKVNQHKSRQIDLFV